MASDAEVTDILEQIAKQGEAWKTGTGGAREALMSNAEKLRSALITPAESMILTQWAQPTHNTALRIASEIQLFEALAADGGSPKTSERLAEMTSPLTDHALVARVLRHLAAMGTLREPQPDTFEPTPFATAMAREDFKDSCAFMFDDYTPALIHGTQWVKENGYKAPTSVVDTPWHHAYQAPPEPLWVYFAKSAPLMGKRFASMMQVYSAGRPPWYQEGYYPIKERLIQGADSNPDSIFLVDVGSGAGHDASRLLQYMGSDIPGKIVLQDRPEVMEIAEKEAASETIKMPHDFLTEQPVKGARAYYLHSIIHDWPDEDSVQILRSIVPAMTPGYSKILICDCVLANQGAHWLLTALDWLVLCGLAARERTANEFSALATRAGLKIVQIFKHPQSLDSLIELELA